MNLSKQKFLNKNQLQELLLGLGLYLRDYEFSCFADPELELPGFLVESKMAKEDDTSINRVLQLLSEVLNQETKCVSHQTGSLNANTVKVMSPSLHHPRRHPSRTKRRLFPRALRRCKCTLSDILPADCLRAYSQDKQEKERFPS